MISVNKVKAQSFLNAYREDTWHLGVGPDLAAVVNPAPTQTRLGAGAQVHFLYYTNPNVGLSISTGFLTVLSKSGSREPNYTLVPFTVGAKAFISSSVYLGTDVGLGYVSPKQNSAGSTKILAPSIGYNDPDSNFDINLRYQVDHQHDGYLSMLALHISYYFDLTRSYY